ncbi:MAG: serine hydrolase domain-containing protein [Candidatus Hadarchaeum sp.]|uniref:serine hydrolase domain-containing protein n=1 Tax=Candidatus Hadarchaeum sp. TaxID=2883567 RepID=UPI00316EE451
MRWNDLDEFVMTKLKSTNVPSLSLVLVKNNDVAYIRSYGFRDLAKCLPATSQTVYGIASVTKCFTAVAILQLVERGRILLETPVEEILPLHLRPCGRPICIHHLLTHTSGIPALDHLESEIIDMLRGITNAPGVTNVLAWLNKSTDWVDAAPGEKWFYFNEGYTILGGVIEQVCGVPYKEYLKEHVLDPLAMRSTGLLGENFDNFAIPYLVTPEGGTRPAPIFSFPVGSEAGLASCVLDLVKFIICLINKGSPLISAELFAEMIKPRANLPRESVIPAARKASYGYGFVIEPFLDSMTLIGHPGGIIVYTSYLGFIPEAHVGVAVLANGQGPSMAQLAQVALAYLLGYDFSLLPFVKLESMYQKILGIYHSCKGRATVCVQRVNGGLYLTFLGGVIPTSIPLHFHELDGSTGYFYAQQEDARFPVVFRFREDQTELIYDCYKFRRTSRPSK